MEDTEPYVQRLFHGPCLETGMGSQDLKLAYGLVLPAPEAPMNPAEEIVKFWLQQNGYFIQSSIRVEKGQGREIDILAVDVQGKHKRHIEVTSSINSVLTKSIPEEAEIKSSKFEHPAVRSEVAKRFGTGATYSKEYVVGNIGRNKQQEYAAEMEKLGITIIPISAILKEVAPALKKNRQLNPALQAIAISMEFLSNQP